MHHPACTNRAVLVAAATLAVMASGTHASLTFTNSTTANGLGDNYVLGVYESGGTIYAATYGGGLGTSTNGGVSWTNYTAANGLGSNLVLGVYESGGTIYAATDGGLSTSTNGGVSWTNYTTANGLGNNFVRGVYESGGTIYAATYGGGLSIANVTAVPGAGVAGLATIGLVGSRRRRR